MCSEEPRYRLMLDPMVLDPLERGHHDKDPSKDEEISDFLYTDKGYLSTLYCLLRSKFY